MFWRDRIAYGSMGGGGGGGGSSTQTVTQSQQIPAFEQQFAQSNQDLARSLAAQPYPTYQAPLVAGMTPTQQVGEQQAINAAGSYQPALAGATAATIGALGMDPLSRGGQAVNAGLNQIGGSQAYGMPAVNAGLNAIGSVGAGNPANPGVIQQYMSPYVQAALQPQITALNTQLGQQQNQINAQATSANAFGDARQGSANALANFYGNQSLSGLLANGYNQAYSNALQTAQGQQQLGLQSGQALANIGQNQQQLGLQSGQALANIGLGQTGAGIQEQQQLLGGGAQLGNLANQAQSLGLQGANAVYDVGQQQQQLAQQGLNTAYQQFQNQAQWPYQQLNVLESALSNSPYNITNQTTLPNANMTAQNLGMFAGLAGLLGGGASGGAAPYGGSVFNSATAHA